MQYISVFHGPQEYNLRIGSPQCGAEIVPAAAATNRLRRLVDRGNVGQRTLWQLTEIPTAGTFFWSVQAIDGSFAGSQLSLRSRAFWVLSSRLTADNSRS